MHNPITVENIVESVRFALADVVKYKYMIGDIDPDDNMPIVLSTNGRLGRLGMPIPNPDINARWKDRRLVDLLNAALSTVTLEVDLFTEAVKIAVANNMPDQINMSDRATKLLRVEYQGQLVPFITFEELDEIRNNGGGERGTYNDTSNTNSTNYTHEDGFGVGLNWQQDVGEHPRYAVVNKQNVGKFLLYPRIETAPQNSFGILAGNNSSRAVDFRDIPGNGLSADSKTLVVRYIRRMPTYLASPLADLVMDDMEDVSHGLDTVVPIFEDFKQCIIHYIASMAYSDAQEEESAQQRDFQLRLYQAKLEQFRADKANNFVDRSHKTTYKPFG